MKPELQRAIIDRLLARVGQPVTCGEDARVAVSAYTSQARFEAERAMFRRTPIAIAHASEIASAGAFVTRDVADMPVLVVRGEDGVRAFVNVCRHRGTRSGGGGSARSSRLDSDRTQEIAHARPRLVEL